MGEYLAKGLATLKERHRCIKEVRGMGLLRGIEVDFDGKAVVADCLARGLLINCVGDPGATFRARSSSRSARSTGCWPRSHRFLVQRTTSTH